MSSSFFGGRLVLVATLGAAVALTVPAPAVSAGPSDPAGLSQAVGLAVRGVNVLDSAETTSHYVMRTDRTGRWAFGSAVLHPAPNSHDYPKAWLYVAQRTGAKWRVGLEFSSEFAALRNEAPTSVLTTIESDLLAPKKDAGGIGIQAAPNDPYTGLSLPWAVGQSWALTSGPHQATREAVDLAGGDGRVLSAGAGATFAMCSQPGNPGWVRVYHATGFSTDYYHLANNVNPGGAWLPRGSFLGNISNDVSCGGFSTGPHTHFSSYWGDTPIPINNHTFGGWTFFAGTNEREGWATRGGTTVNIGGTLLNHGVIESAISTPKSDFTGDGRADIATFTMGNTGDVFVSPSNGTSFTGTGVGWHGSFGFGEEVVLTGDFNRDGRDDIATFTRGSTADVYVALSTGTVFSGNGVRWHSNLVSGMQIPGIGDHNGDGCDDIIIFTRGSTADVFVALSNCSNAFGNPVLTHTFFAAGDEYPAIGDVNGDGRDDIITFTRDTSGDVYIALSNGSTHNNSALWHTSFCFWDELPAIGDFNGDGRDDIATFTRGPAADVYVATSNGSSFVGNGVLWNGSFAPSTNLPATGDVDRDGDDDIIAFTRGAEADVRVSLSNRSSFVGNALWHSFFAFGNETPRPSTM